MDEHRQNASSEAFHHGVDRAGKKLDGKRTTPETYARVFVGHADGALILEDLVAKFYDQRSFTAGGVEGARMTDFKEGRREVVRFILAQLGQVKEGDPNVEA